MTLTRRALLKVGAFGIGATAAGVAVPLGGSASTSDWVSDLPDSKLPRPYTKPLPMSPRLPYRNMSDSDGPYRLYTVTERSAALQIIDGLPTPVLGYGFTDIAGQPQLSCPGPIISVPQGTRVKLRVKNQLPAQHPQWGHELITSTHLHGSASLPQYDGYADDVTAPGQYKDYWYPNFQPARTLWYHDHGMHVTAQNAYSGMYAQYHLHDPVETDLLPQGRYDVALTIADAMFAANGSLAYQDEDHSGLWGDVILVNGVAWPYMEVQRRLYRFRILVAGLSRSYNLRLVNVATRQSVPVHVVATDGGLMPKPQPVTSWRHAGAERYEILVDFSKFGSLPAGSKFELRNSSNKNNRDYLHTGKVMQFRLSDEPVLDTSRNTVPGSLVNSPIMALQPSQAKRINRIELDHDDDTNEFQIDGKTWRDVQDSGYELLADGANPDIGDIEIWEIENKSGGWFHPIHIHLIDFKILSRRGGSGRVQPWEQGPKDTVYVGEGEIIRLITRYEVAPTSTGKAGATSGAGGRYMIHCHNLPHEDHDMMLQFQVGDTPEVNDPIHAAPPRPIPGDGVYDDGPEQTPDQM